jgi:hypothetical protein
MLPPLAHDISASFTSEFEGMTTEVVTLAHLVETRERLFVELPVSLDAAERHFLLSVKKGAPDWEILGLPGIEKMPSLRWKVINIVTLATRDPAKHKGLVDVLAKKLNIEQEQ